MENNVFEVGLVLSFETHYKNYLSTHVVGWEPDNFVLTKAIYIQGQPAKLKTSDVCRVRFLQDGVAYGFESEVMMVQFFPYPLMFIAYPAKIETLKIRLSTRYKIRLPARLSDASGTLIADDAVIIDISEGGCGLKVPVQEGKELSPEIDYQIAFQVMDKEVSMGCSVRKFDKGGDYGYILGMEFSTIMPQCKETLLLFLGFLSNQLSTT